MTKKYIILQIDTDDDLFLYVNEGEIYSYLSVKVTGETKRQIFEKALEFVSTLKTVTKPGKKSKVKGFEELRKETLKLLSEGQPNVLIGGNIIIRYDYYNDINGFEFII